MAEKDFKKIEYSDMRVTWETFPELCKSCGLCIEKCPVKCLAFDHAHNEYLGMSLVKCDVAKCIACHTCENGCPDSAIKVKGRR